MSVAGWGWLIFCSASVVAANILLRYGIDRAHVTLFAEGLLALPGQILRLLLEPAFFASLFFYGLAMLSWFRLVATEQLSVAYPVLSAFTFVSITVLAVLLFHEPFGLRKGMGLAAILLGLYLMSSST